MDGHWVLNSDFVQEFRRVSRAVEKGELPPERLAEIRKEFRDKTKTGIMPAKALFRLTGGTEGSVKLLVRRSGKLISNEIKKTSTEVDPVVSAGEGVVQLRFVPGASDSFKGKLAGLRTIDLRNCTFGDLQEMQQILGMIAPAGQYGQIVRQKGAINAIKTTSGGQTPAGLTLLVDGSTRGVAGMFARALSAKGLAKLSGALPKAEPKLVEGVKLPDGSGFTLVTGIYKSPMQEKRS